MNMRKDGDIMLVCTGGIVIESPPEDVCGTKLCRRPARAPTKLRLNASSVSDFLRRYFLTRSEKRVKLSLCVPCLCKGESECTV